MYQRGADRPPVRPEDGEVCRAAERSSGSAEARLEEIRRRVASGGYESPEIMKCVARRILERGDL